MARIIYGMAGEGRGHAARARAVAEALRPRHEVRLLASGEALALLEPLYRQSEVRVEPIPGLRFRYKRNRLDLSRSIAAALPFLLKLKARSSALARELIRWGTDLAIVDFEPILPRAARQAGIPYASLDHQHLLVAADLSGLPPGLRRWSAWLGLAVRLFCSGQSATLISSFYFPGVRPGWEGQVLPVGVPLRPELKGLSPSLGSHLVAYLRGEPPASFLNMLAATGHEIHVYGLDVRPSLGRLSFRPVSSHPFLSDLAGAKALISSAGNQLLGESLFLGKPILALPEPGNREQEINAWLLERSGMGEQARMESFAPPVLAGFLARANSFLRADPLSLNGTPMVVEALERLLPTPKKSRLAS